MCRCLKALMEHHGPSVTVTLMDHPLCWCDSGNVLETKKGSRSTTHQHTESTLRKRPGQVSYHRQCRNCDNGVISRSDGGHNQRSHQSNGISEAFIRAIYRDF